MSSKIDVVHVTIVMMVNIDTKVQPTFVVQKALCNKTNFLSTGKFFNHLFKHLQTIFVLIMNKLCLGKLCDAMCQIHYHHHIKDNTLK